MLGVRDVWLMLVIAVVSIRWIPRGARAGALSLPLWIAAGLAFFLPLVLAVKDLSAKFPEEGGLYVWAHRTYGPAHGFLCGWCLWLNQIFFFPSYLLFAFANFAVLTPLSLQLASRRGAGVAFVLLALWLLTGLNVVGFSVTKWIQNIGTAGIWIPIGLLFTLAAIHLLRGQPAIFSRGLPHAGFAAGLTLWSSMCFAFSGVEIVAFVGQEIRNPARSIPLAVGTAAVFITVVYVGGSLAILLALRPEGLNDITGLADAIGLLLGWPWVQGTIAALLAVAALATTSSWVAGAARIACVAGQERAFPAVLGRLHGRFCTPHVALLVQAVAASGALLVSLFLRVDGRTTRLDEAYDLLVNLTILLYFVPYLYLFAIAMKKIPGRMLIGGLGMGTTTIAIGLLFLPPPGTASVWNFEFNLMMQAGGILLAGAITYRLLRRKEKGYAHGS